MSDEMHVTKTEPVLRWQTKEEIQRWERRVHEAKQRRKDGVDDEKEGRKRGRGIQSDGEGEKVESESNEGKQRRGPRHEEQLKESEEVKIKGEKKGASENSVKLIPTSHEKKKTTARKSLETSLEFGSPVINATHEIVKKENNKPKDAFGISNFKVAVAGSSFVIDRKELLEAEAREEVEVEESRRVKAAKSKKDNGRIRDEIKRIKEENMRIKGEKVVDQAERGIKETRRGRESQRRVSEVEDICNNNDKSGVGEETHMSVSVSEDTVGWLLGNNRRALAFIQEHCNVSMNVEERKRGGGRPIVLISGSLREVSKAGEIVKLDVGQPQLVLTDAGATRLTKDRSRVEER